MTFILSGDSWGMGVFKMINDQYGPTGEGIETLLKSYGHNVINISKAGGSNWLMVDRLNHRWNNRKRCSYGVDPSDKIDFDLKDIDAVIFLQTDAFREKHRYVKQYSTDTHTQWKRLDDEFIDELLTYHTLEDAFQDYFENLYSALNCLNVPIYCVGGWGKLHPCIKKYSNLIPAIESAITLLIPHLEVDTYISDIEWIDQLSNHNKFMDKFGTEFKKLAVDCANKYYLVLEEWSEVHPNLDGYKKILDEVLAKQK